MKWSLFALCIGFCIDLLIGDPHGLPHPVAAIGHLISLLERLFRRLFPKTPGGERAAGACIWILTALIAAALPALLLWGCARVSVWLRLAVESVMCGQILAAKSLRDESMKVCAALEHGSLDEARQAVSMIVGRDGARLDARGVMRAAVETVAENTSDGVIAPMLFLAIGGAPLGFFYKAVNTMDSMLGYVEPPYKDIGLVPARMDDVFNFIPARLSALLMLAAGALLAVFFFLFLPFYGTDTVRAAPEFAWAYWPCLVWAWAFAVPIFWAMVPAWRVCGSIAVKGMAFTGKNARDLRTVSRLAFADAVIFPAGMLIVAYLGAGSAPLTLLITPLVTFCCLAAGIVLYVLSRLVADAAALREDNDLTI